MLICFIADMVFFSRKVVNDTVLPFNQTEPYIFLFFK